MDPDTPRAAVPPAAPDATGKPDPEPAAPPVSWPPPALERVQGDLWRVAGQVGPGGALLSLPLLLSASSGQDFWSLGVFGEAWWVVVVTSLVGSVLLIRGLVDLFRMFRRWAGAAKRGYAHRTVAVVLTDQARDAGFVLQGAQAYSLLPAGRRRAILTTRVAVGALVLAGSLWLSVGFVVGALMASRGVLGEAGLAYWTLGPLVGALVAAVVLQSWENGVVRRARRAWYKRPGSTRLDGESISEWHESVRRSPDAVPVAGEGGRTGVLHAAAALTVLACVAVPVVGLVLTALSGVGPVLASTEVPSFRTTQSRAATVQAVDGYRLPTDPGITAREAAEAMASLASVDEWPSSDLLRDPPRNYEGPVFPEGTPGGVGGPTGVYPGTWATELMPRVAEGLDEETLRFLEERASHPALAEIGVMARAGGLDEVSALWVSPLPPDMAIWELPIPRYRGIREAAYAHIGGAVADAARGRTDAAEVRLREVLSMGLLMADEGSTLITNLIGLVLARNGADALAELYEATGRTDHALALRGRLQAAERATEVALVGTEWSTATALKAMPDLVLDEDAVRGRRWDSFMLLNTIGPCVNLNRALFGADEGYERWVEEVRGDLVRWPADESLFEAARAGYFGRGGEPASVIERVLRVLLGADEAGANGCAVAVGQMVR